MDTQPVPLDPNTGPQRLDAWLSETLPTLSRARWQDLIKQGLVQVDGEPRKPRHLLHGGETVTYTIPSATDVELVPEDLNLQVLYEDGDIIVINKPAGMVVHPAPGHDTGTLVHALLHHCTDLQGVSGERRPGIVHRLDKDTSGVLVAAKHEQALHDLQQQFKSRNVDKEYLALVWGCPSQETGTIDATIGRSPHHRVRMAADPPRGRLARTTYVIEESFPDVSLLRLCIETGRTHQIRVHMSHLHHPVIGDTLYGGERNHPWIHPARQMLHAHQLSLFHPKTRERMVFTAMLPPDFQELLDILRRESGG